MVPYSHAGQLRQCASGEFDSRIRSVRDNMLAGRGPMPDEALRARIAAMA